MDEETQVLGAESPETTEAPETTVETSVSETPPPSPMASAIAAFEEQEAGVPKPSTVPSAVVSGKGTTANPDPPRVFDGLETKEEREWFNRMSRPAYNALYPQYLEYKKLKGEYEGLQKENTQLKGSTFFDQEDAYSITPEYKGLTNNLNLIDGEAQYWTQQLANIESGAKVTMLTGYDGKTGQYSFSNELDPSPQLKAEVISKMNQAYSLKMHIQGKLDNYTSQFNTQRTGFMENMQSVRNKVFQGVDLGKLEKLAGSKLKMFPAFIQGHPTTKLLAEALVIIEGLTAQLGKTRSQTTTNAIKARTLTGAGPGAATITPGNGNGKAGSMQDVLKQFKQEETKLV